MFFIRHCFSPHIHSPPVALLNSADLVSVSLNDEPGRDAMRARILTSYVDAKKKWGTKGMIRNQSASSIINKSRRGLGGSGASAVKGIRDGTMAQITGRNVNDENRKKNNQYSLSHGDNNSSSFTVICICNQNNLCGL